MRQLERTKGLDTATKYAVKLAQGVVKTTKIAGSVANVVFNPFAKVGLAYRAGNLLYKGAGLFGSGKALLQSGKAIYNFPNSLRNIKQTQAYKTSMLNRTQDLYQSSSFKTAARNIQSNYGNTFTQTSPVVKKVIAKQINKTNVAVRDANKAIIAEKKLIRDIGSGATALVKIPLHTLGLVKGYDYATSQSSPVKQDDSKLKKLLEKSKNFTDKEFNRLLNLK